MLEFGDAFFGSMERDHSGHCHAIRVPAVLFGSEFVEGAADCLAHFVVLHVRESETNRGIEHDVVHAHLVHALVQQTRHHRRGAVERVLGRQRPPGRDGHPLGSRSSQLIAAQRRLTLESR